MPNNDPRHIWQNQPKETSPMTLESIRQKSQELHAKTRRALLSGLASPLGVLALSGLALKWFDSPLHRALCLSAVIWSLAGQYFYHRGMWSAIQPADSGLASYRREVARRRTLSGRFLLWHLGPVLLALATFTAPLVNVGLRQGMLQKMIPFLTLLFGWIVAVIVMRLRDQRELQREIAILDDLERADRP